MEFRFETDDETNIKYRDVVQTFYDISTEIHISRAIAEMGLHAKL